MCNVKKITKGLQAFKLASRPHKNNVILERKKNQQTNKPTQKRDIVKGKRERGRDNSYRDI